MAAISQKPRYLMGITFIFSTTSATEAPDNIKHWLNNPDLKFIQEDLLNSKDLMKAMKGCEIVYHLAANPEVRVSSISPNVYFQQNVVAT